MAIFVPPKKYYASKTKKAAGANVLLIDEDERLLIVKPNYKNGWILPGGWVDAPESPRAAAIRETKEELGIFLDDPKLMSVIYEKPSGVKPEIFHFCFFGGIVETEEIARIKLQKEELDDFKFTAAAEAREMLAESYKKRVFECLNLVEIKDIWKLVSDGRVIYAEI